MKRYVAVTLAIASFTLVHAELFGSASAATKLSNAWGSYSTSHNATVTDQTPLLFTDQNYQTYPGHSNADLEGEVIARAQYTPGQLHAQALANIYGNLYPSGYGPYYGMGTVEAHASASAYFQTNDVVLSGVPDPNHPNDPFTASLNLALSGFLSKVTNFDPFGDSASSRYVYAASPSTYDSKLLINFSVAQNQLVHQLEGPDIWMYKSLAGGYISATAHYDGSIDINSYGLATPLMSWTNGTQTLATDSFSVLPFNPSDPIEHQHFLRLFMSIEVDTAEQYSHSGGDVIKTNLDFGNTFGLPTLGDSFNVPTGVSVNSQSLNIVDNHFHPVPEPMSVLAALMGSFVAVARKRRR